MDAIRDWLVWFWTEKLGEASFRTDLIWDLATLGVITTVVLTWFANSGGSMRRGRRIRIRSRRLIRQDVRRHLSRDLARIPRVYRR